MKIYRNKILVLLFFSFSSVLFSSTIEISGYKLEIKENSGRFELSMKNGEGEYVSVFSNDDLRTSSFNIYENNGFYTLGDSFRYRKSFEETSKGGVFVWTSKELLIEQVLALDSDGFLTIDFSIMNISSNPRSVGMKYLIDTTFENEDYFYLKLDNGTLEIDSEFEVDDPDKVQYWTSGLRNSNGASLMMIPTVSLPSRIIFGNWDLLNDAGYYYRTVSGRAYNNPPYSINDSAVLYLYSPFEILPQKKMNISICLRAIATVENHNDITFKEKRTSATPANESEEIEVNFETESIIAETPIEDEEEIEVPAIIPESEPPEEIAEVEKVEEVEEALPEVLEESEPLIKDKKKLFIEQQLFTVEEIRKIIESLSKPGIIDQNKLSELEERIKKLEEIDIDEN